MIHSPTARHGSVLIVVLWLVTILGISTAALAYERRTEMRIARNRIELARVDMIARGGVEWTLAVLHRHGPKKCHAPTMDWWSAKSQYDGIELGAGSFRIVPEFDSGKGNSSAKAADAYGLADEESKLNVNNASLAMLMKVPDMAQDIAEAIVRKRKELSGDGKSSSLVTTLAEAREEKKAEQGILATPFASLDDLLQVSGVTKEMLYGKDQSKGGLAQYLTARSSGKVNVNSASGAVLKAIGVKDDNLDAVKQQQGAGGFASLDAFFKAAKIEMDKEDKASADKKSSASDSEIDLREFLALRSNNFRFACIAQSRRGLRVAVHSRVTLSDEEVRVTSWRSTRLKSVAVTDETKTE